MEKETFLYYWGSNKPYTHLTSKEPNIKPDEVDFKSDFFI